MNDPWSNAAKTKYVNTGKQVKGTGLPIVTPEDYDIVPAFSEFVKAASNILGKSATNPKISRFEQFAAQSQTLLENRGTAAVTLAAGLAEDQIVHSFAEFTQSAIPLICERVKRLAAVIRSRVILFSRWMVQHDLLGIAGVGFAENAYTELIAWALDPDTHPATAMLRQSAWIASLGLDGKAFTSPATPQTQVWTSVGILDLVLRFNSFAVIVEAKTGTKEHPVPSGTMQTLAYPSALPNPGNLPIWVVFITADGSDAANALAINTTFAKFAISLAEVLEEVSLPDEIRFAYATLITHLVHLGTNLNISVLDLMARLKRWASLPNFDCNEVLLSNMSDLMLCLQLFSMENPGDKSIRAL